VIAFIGGLVIGVALFALLLRAAFQVAVMRGLNW
jgi:hypothetical protein